MSGSPEGGNLLEISGSPTGQLLELPHKMTNLNGNQLVDFDPANFPGCFDAPDLMLDNLSSRGMSQLGLLEAAAGSAPDSEAHGIVLELENTSGDLAGSSNLTIVDKKNNGALVVSLFERTDQLPQEDHLYNQEGPSPEDIADVVEFVNRNGLKTTETKHDGEDAVDTSKVLATVINLANYSGNTPEDIKRRNLKLAALALLVASCGPPQGAHLSAPYPHGSAGEIWKDIVNKAGVIVGSILDPTAPNQQAPGDSGPADCRVSMRRPSWADDTFSWNPVRGGYKTPAQFRLDCPQVTVLKEYGKYPNGGPGAQPAGVTLYTGSSCEVIVPPHWVCKGVSQERNLITDQGWTTGAYLISGSWGIDRFDQKG